MKKNDLLLVDNGSQAYQALTRGFLKGEGKLRRVREISWEPINSASR